ncbi:MAG: cysteine desulfurase, partial [Balneolales bacterium]
KEGDEVLISTMEHHSNIVPWKMLCDEKKAILKVIPLKDNGELDLEAYSELLTDKTKIVGVMHVSNALGTINPVKEMIALAHERNVPVLVDGAQAVPHITVDVQDLDCDFYALSGHKMFGPTGVGVLYGKKELLEEMPPYRGGGDMILSVSFDEIIYNKIPHKFEAGTPGIAQVIGIAKAAEYLMAKGRDKLYAYENDLLQYATEKLSEIEGLKIIGTAKNKASVISFVIEGVHPHDIGTILDQEGIAVRTGHHCAQPVMDRYEVPATTRASFAFYNTTDEVDKLVEGIKTVIEIFR